MIESKFKKGDIVKLTNDGYEMRIVEVILPKELGPRIKDHRFKVGEVEYFCQWHDVSGKLCNNQFLESSLLLA
jgi:uncharacterized protein YodC (DUF2158 family)